MLTCYETCWRDVNHVDMLWNMLTWCEPCWHVDMLTRCETCRRVSCERQHVSQHVNMFHVNVNILDNMSTWFMWMSTFWTTCQHVSCGCQHVWQHGSRGCQHVSHDINMVPVDVNMFDNMSTWFPWRSTCFMWMSTCFTSCQHVSQHVNMFDNMSTWFPWLSLQAGKFGLIPTIINSVTALGSVGVVSIWDWGFNNNINIHNNNNNTLYRCRTVNRLGQSSKVLDGELKTSCPVSMCVVV